MTNLSVAVVGLNHLRSKGNPAYSAANIFEKIKIFTLPDNMSDTLIIETVIGRGNPDGIKCVGITIYRHFDIIIKS